MHRTDHVANEWKNMGPKRAGSVEPPDNFSNNSGLKSDAASLSKLRREGISYPRAGNLRQY